MSESRIDFSRQYFDETSIIFNFSNLSDLEVDILIEKLIDALPNSKHLYKYRSFKSDKFDLTLDNLRNKEIYFPLANELNDKIDCTFNYKSLRTEEEIVEYLKKNKYRLYLANIEDKPDFEEDRKIVKLLNQKEDVSFVISKMKEKNVPLNLKIKVVQNIKKTVNEKICSSGYIEETIEKFNNLGSFLRNRFRVFSLCESCEQASMWAYYCGDNNGYCIEYDLNKLRDLDYQTKRVFLSFYKVRYGEEQKPIDAFDLFEAAHSFDPKNEKQVQTNKTIIESFITKSKSWEQEKEWRVLITGNNSLIKADLVSGIIIDEDFINTERAEQLVSLAKEKGWSVRIRHLNRDFNKFENIDYC